MSTGVVRGTVAALAVVTALLAGVLFHASGTSATAARSWCVEAAVVESLPAADGPRVWVIGDSYTEGGWPVELDGRITVDGFSGTGFTDVQRACPGTAFADRAAVAAAADPDLVVIQGGLNDYESSPAAIRAGVAAVVDELDGTPVVIVGPVAAPERAHAAARVDRALAEASADAGVPYVRTSGWSLPFAQDAIHLTERGYRLFGQKVAERLDIP